eukprot:CAMPEP_0202753616 /NCGR_PEP_ID=MMETSP1388-20130828/13722_1 /ASSEMBLY_ACC=CAM_ASM_000864 /TAXON_ID=37098 /ORGANISM="Isochrysis sp, Strain CCMP1244" /LENGTH=93 /DNA_ID=CAMNT_0049421371 /DNA_START=274 /DNA_END=555 /DNA_ORIENTATION=+
MAASRHLNLAEPREDRTAVVFGGGRLAHLCERGGAAWPVGEPAQQRLQHVVPELVLQQPPQSRGRLVAAAKDGLRRGVELVGGGEREHHLGDV